MYRAIIRAPTFVFKKTKVRSLRPIPALFSDLLKAGLGFSGKNLKFAARLNGFFFETASHES